MPALLVVIGNIVLYIAGKLFEFFAKKYARRFALTLTYYSMIVAFWAAFALAITAAIKSISLVVPDYFYSGFAMFMPDNLTLCLAAIGTAKTADFLIGIKEKLAKPFWGSQYY